MSDPSLESPSTGLVCGHCRYDLRGITSDRCPECGRRFDPSRLLSDHLPWEQRRQIGRFRAYRHTLRLFLFQPHVAARAVERPVNLSDARHFGWITLLLALGGVMLIFVHLHDALPWRSWEIAEMIRLLLEPGWPRAITLTGLILGVFAALSLPGYFFHTRRLPIIQQNRAVALSHYTPAPLALLPLLVIISLTFEWLEDEFYDLAELLKVVTRLAQFLIPPLFFAWWLNTLILLRKTTGCGPARLIAAGVSLPILAAVLPPLLIASLHLLTGYAVLIYLSFQL